jgi:hypothetical protein
MRSLLLAAAALALAGCADLKPVKAYAGADRPDGELAILQSEFVRDLHKSSDIEIDVLDGVNYGQRKYAAKLLPGKHRAGLRHLLQYGSEKQQRFCSFEFDALAGCNYVPHPPESNAAFAAARAPDWRESFFMPVSVRCANLAYEARVATECANRKLW